MGSYTLDEIKKRWELGTLTTEQTIGQMLLQMEALSRRVGTLEKRLESQRNGKGSAAQTEAG